MKKILIILYMFSTFSLYGEQSIKVVSFSRSISPSVIGKINSNLKGIKILGIPSYPTGVTLLNYYYKKIKENYSDFNYDKALRLSQKSVNVAKKNFINIKQWELLEKIIKMQMVIAFGMRKNTDLDQAIWNYNRWFYYKELKGKNIPPDLYLKWKNLHDKGVTYELSFNSTVSDVVIQIDGRVIKSVNSRIFLPQGVHRIYWFTPYESKVEVKEVFGNYKYKIDAFPINISKIREIVINDNWCSEKFDELFSTYSYEEYLLFVDTKLKKPFLIFVDTDIPGVITKGGYSVFNTIREVVTNFDDEYYSAPLLCKWETVPFYRKWWFYFGVGAIFGGGGYLGYEIHEKNIEQNTGVIVDW